MAKNKKFNIDLAVSILRDEILKYKVPVVSIYAAGHKKQRPFKVLISTLLSLRTRDEATALASRRLFARAGNAEKISLLPVEEIEKLIKSVGFYRVKAKNVKEIAWAIHNRHDNKVPESIDELLKFNGVGRKTANLVVTLGYSLPGICVDTHVHRICRIWGYTNEPTPDKTEMALRKKLPEKYWIEFNDLLVTFGQNLCKPVSPFCSRCPLDDICPRNGVGKNR